MRFGGIIRAGLAGALTAAFSAVGCNSYPVVLLKENALSTTPYMQVASHPTPKDWPADRLTVTWVGHATALLNFYGTVILTDPVLSERLGPPELFGVNCGIRRITELPVPFEEFPPVNVVLLSHAHQDHWDMPSLRRFDARTQAIIPTGDSDLVPAGKFGKVTELAWGQKAAVGDVEIRAFQVSHWGARIGAPDKPRGYNGYVISGHGRQVVFIGDTAYGDATSGSTGRSVLPRGDIIPADWPARIGATNVDLCILPIGEYIYHTNHMTPEEAWSIAQSVNARHLLATHWRTFILSPRPLLPTFEPMERLQKAAGHSADNQPNARSHSQPTKIICIEPGQAFTLPE
jgi:L-ascorbate metabolism protein UlaG (beta-lactamase superfamily)